MANKMYEEENIRAIAEKIRTLIPSWSKGITTLEMPSAIERVYAEGKKNGRSEGYGSGYSSGYNEGYNRGNNIGYDNGLKDGTEQALNSIPRAEGRGF